MRFLVWLMCLTLLSCNVALADSMSNAPGAGGFSPGGVNGDPQINNNGSFGGLNPITVNKGGTGAQALTGIVQGSGTSALTGLTDTQVTTHINTGTDLLKGAVPPLTDAQVVVGKTGSAAQAVTMSGDVTITNAGVTAIKSSVALAGNPTTTTQASTINNTTVATTSYVTTAVANAIAAVNPAVAVTAATAAILPNSPIYANGVAGVGATITTLTTNTPLVVDGVTPTLNQRILVKNESSGGGLGAADNGVYFVSQVSGVALAWILTRALDYDQPSDINNTGSVPVVSGTANASTSWVITSAVATVGTDPLTYSNFTVNPSNIATTTNAIALANGMTATTQSASDNSTKVATTAYADAAGNIGVFDATWRWGVTFPTLNNQNVPLGAGIDVGGAQTATGNTSFGAAFLSGQLCTTVTFDGNANDFSEYTTGAANTLTQTAANPKFYASWGTTTNTNCRKWVGLASAAPNTNTTTANSLLFRFNTTAGDTHWQAIETDNANAADIVDTGITPSTSGLDTFLIDCTNPSAPKFTLNGTPITMPGTHVPTTTTGLDAYVYHFTLSNDVVWTARMHKMALLTK